MKILKFIKWQWAKFDAWQKWYIVACALGGAGAFNRNPTEQKYLLGIAVLIGIGLVFNWLVLSTIKSSYKEFEKEYNGLFDKIKDSEK